MRKVTKILLKALSVTLLFLIFCPIVLTLVVELPSVQNYLIDRATQFASEKLETKVSIDRIKLGVLGSVRVDGFYVEDYQQDTLLYVGKLRVYLSRIPDEGGVVLRNGVIANSYLNIRETPEGVMNIKQVVERLTNKDRQKKSNFVLKVEDVRIDDFSLVIEQQEHRNPSYGIDYKDMHLEHMSAFVDNFMLDGGRIGGYIRNFSTIEHSGFMVQNFTGRFMVDKGLVELRDFEVMAEKSDIRLPYFTLRGEDWQAYKDFINNVVIEGEIRRSAASTDDIAHFAPRMLPWNLSVRGVNAKVKGTVADLKVDVESLKFGQQSELQGEVSFRGLPDVKRAGMSVKLEQLRSCEEDFAWLLAGITGRELPAKVRQIMNNSGELICSGTFSGGMKAFESELSLFTEAGNVLLRAERAQMPEPESKPQPDDNPQSNDKPRVKKPVSSTLKADVELSHVDLGHVLDVNSLGRVDGLVQFDGLTNRNEVRGHILGRVDNLDFKGCDYQDITVDGMVINKSFSGQIESKSAPLNFKLTGLADLNSERAAYDFRLNLREADLAAMKINKRDTLSKIQLDAELYAVGHTIEDINGAFTIERGEYRYNEDSLSTGLIRLIAENSDKKRSLSLSSDFADASFTGPTSYGDVVRYLRSAMRKYLPNISNESTSLYESAGDEGYSALTVTAKNVDPLLDAISDGLQLANGSTLHFVMNPASNHLTLRAESDYLERDKMLITKLNLNVTNQADSLAMYLQTEDLYSGALHIPNLSVMGGAKNDRVMLDAAFKDQEDSFSGRMALLAHLTRVMPSMMPRVNLTLLPTHIKNDNKTWRITSDPISLDTARVVVNNFMIRSGSQLLELDGVASRSRQDSLSMQMRDFELTPFMGLASRMGYQITGLCNGVASLKAALNRGELTADIDIDSMKVNDTPVVPLCIDSRWDLDQQRVRVAMKNRKTNREIVRGYYAPQSQRYYAEGELDNLPMNMLDPLLKGVVSATEGTANAKLEILGQGREAKLNGSVNVENLSTMLDYTRVRYSVHSAKVKVEDNHFKVTNARVYDAENNIGSMTMDLNLNHLSNITYDMRVVPRSMIVLNTTAQDNDLFYGKVYASGVATVSGNKKGTTINITASSEGNSQFYMPLSSKMDASNADFVVFEKPGVEQDTTNYLMRKKMMFERRARRSTASENEMKINMALTANRNTEVQLVIDPTVGDIIKARGEGSLNLQIVPSANIFDMYGDYTISDGSYLFTLQNIINKRFLIESGSTIQWTGDPMDARLDIDAVYKLKASLQPLLSSTTLDNVTRAVPVECIINLTERLTSPTVTFDIKVPNADSEIQNAVANLLNNQQSIATQFMYLLVSGSFYSDSGTSSNIGASASATTGFELLSNQLSNWLSSDDYNIILRYRPKSELTSDEIDFGFSKSLVNDRLLVEVEGNYLVDNRMAQSSNMSNFMGEAYITWLLDRNGNLKLKGFTQTIDRFDENQGLQETGVGIYYKEDFNNWADLKRRIKERFTSRRKRAEQEKAEQESEQNEAENESDEHGQPLPQE